MRIERRSAWLAVTSRELVATWRDARLVLALALVVVLYCAALLLGWLEQRRTHDEYVQARAEVRQAWLEQGERNPHDAGHSGTFAFKPPHPLRVVERGAADYMGHWLHLETHRQNDAQHRRAREATAFFRLGGFGPIHVVSLLLPLVLLIMTHAAVTSEEESGTASLLRASGVSADTVHAGKSAGALLFMAAWLLPLLGLTAVAVIAAAGANAATALSMAAAGGIVVLYCSTFVLLGIALSALCRSSRQALAVSFAAWAVLCVVLPRVGASVAEAAVPAPTAFEFKRALEAERDNKWSIAYRARGSFRAVYAEAEARAMQQQGVTRVEDLTIDPFGLAIEETEEEGQRAYDATLRRVVEAFEQQNAVHRLFGMATPIVALSTGMAALSETDLAAHQRFAAAAEAYRREIMRTLNLDIAYNARLQTADDVSTTGFVRGYVRGADFWATFPEFEPPLRTVRAALASAAPETGWLLAWMLGAALLSRGALRRRWQR